MKPQHRPSLVTVVALMGFALIASCSPIQPPSTEIGAGPLFAVIPSFGVYGTLGLLAVLFPSVFGGVLLLFRQWLALLTVVSVHSVLFFLRWYYWTSLVNSWWGSSSALWLTITFTTLAGVAWAWRRNLNALEPGHISTAAPVRTELIVLWALTGSALIAGAAYVFWLKPPVLADGWAVLFAFCLGFGAAAVYKSYRTIVARWSSRERLDVSTEGVILLATLVVCIGLLTRHAVPASVATAIPKKSSSLVAGDVQMKRTYLDYQGLLGTVVTSPCVVGDRIYVGWAHTDPFDQTKGEGAIFCLNRNTLEQDWEQPFDHDKRMVPVFSSPVVEDGLLYVGEGFHFNPDCHLYCLDPKTGTLRWLKSTHSQVESTPCVANGKVYVGGGDDGVYCLDAKTGKQEWRYGQKLGFAPVFRVGAGVAVDDGRVYVGSGVNRSYPEQCETALVCLHADKKDGNNGQEIWKVPTKFPCWATPIISGNEVLFALGNGDLVSDAPEPAGMILCLDKQTGKERWRIDVDNGILNQPAVDTERVVFGCRDGFVYCVNRRTGKQTWKRDLGSPVLAAPVLDGGHGDGNSHTVFAISQHGLVVCLDIKTGELHWSVSEIESPQTLITSTPALRIDVEKTQTRRNLYFGGGFNNPSIFVISDALPK